MKIILINGPAGSGKDTAAKAIDAFFNGMSPLTYEERLAQPIDSSCQVYGYKMAYPLKQACHTLLGLTGLITDYEHLKETLVSEICPWIKGVIRDMTLRQFYIYQSEQVMKPLFGTEIFGELAVQYARDSKARFMTVSDSGFKSEALPLINAYGADSVLLMQVQRPGYDFTGDSRGYIDLVEQGVEKVVITNDQTVEEFDIKVTTTTQQWFNRG